jgi:hypothetical protein
MYIFVAKQPPLAKEVVLIFCVPLQQGTQNYSNLEDMGRRRIAQILLNVGALL